MRLLVTRPEPDGERTGPLELSLDLERLDVGPPVRRVRALVPHRSRVHDEARHAQ